MTSSYKNLERAIVEELKQDDQLTVCQLFVNLQRTEHSWRDLQDERNACVHNNASFNTNKSVSSIQTMVWEGQKQCHDTTIRSQNAEQLRENGWLRCRCKPQSLKTYDSSEFGVWSSYKGKRRNR